MSVAKNQIINALSPPLPNEIVTNLLDDYIEIKQYFALRKFRPSELNGGRFAESVLRLIQHENTGAFTPFGTSLNNADGIISSALSNTALHESMRFYIPRLARIMLDVRNRRNVAHVGGDVDPNLSDSLFISHSADWVLTEIVRLYYSCSIDIAKKIAESLNEFAIPIIADIDGFLRVQNTDLNARDKALVLLYYKSPSKVSDKDLMKWTKYTNSTNFKNKILNKLDDEAYIHYEGGVCALLPKGIAFVEKTIPLEIII